MKHRLVSIVGGSIGNLVEWYDWWVYSAFSLYFAKVFFPPASQTAHLLNGAARFAAGKYLRSGLCQRSYALFERLSDSAGKQCADRSGCELLGERGDELVGLWAGEKQDKARIGAALPCHDHANGGACARDDVGILFERGGEAHAGNHADKHVGNPMYAYSSWQLALTRISD